VKPRLLDLFCGAGGCTKGFQRAGFEVVGVDISPQPNYCGDDFVQMDALEFLRRLLDGELAGYVLSDFVAIHASPPCQFYSDLKTMANARTDHVNLIPPTRELLERAGLPYVIENVGGARRELRSPTMLCGAAFGLGTATHDLARHRFFETSFDLMGPPCAHRSRKVIGLYGDHARTNRRHSAWSQYNATDSLRYGSEAMGIDWMTWKELAQAIPPAYTEHIGGYLMAEVTARV
jgi:DNA (cytosine-5)-methyltransferase 1